MNGVVLLQTGESSAELDCAEEPIHVPGSIQQHGFFLLVDTHFDKILVASDNMSRYLQLPIRLVLGESIGSILPREIVNAVRLQKVAAEGGVATPEDSVGFLGTFRAGEELFSVVVYCIGEYHALEFERQDRVVGPELMNAVITNFVSALGGLRDEQELCDALARQVSELTGFDRVMLYRFNEAGDGTVLSEINNGRLPSYLHLRFPGTDIPRQARELYVLNTTRIIPDSEYVPSPLVGAEGMSAQSLDLSRSTLRSVSPIHLEYMRNMGTVSSMSVSILNEGRLWGLISGHHAEPKLVPYLVRSACDMLTRMASTQLNAFHTSARLQQMLHFHSVQRNVLTELAGEPHYLHGLASQLPSICGITNAAGVALIIESGYSRFGELPDDAHLDLVVAWLNTLPDFEVYHTSHLGAELGDAAQFRDTGSGLIAIRISSVQQRYLLWFRPQVVRTVRWAGEPAKGLDAVGHLHPRASFDEWKETVRGRSTPWTSMEIDSARDFRAALTTIGLRRAEEAIELGEARFQQLTQSLPAKIFTADDSGRLTYVNERWVRQGMHREGRWYDEPEICPEDAERCAELWKNCVATGSQFEAEIRVRSSESEADRWNLVRITPFQRVGAERAGWIGTFIDLTESKEREMALRMTEKLALTGRMTSVIAHEINNPLEAITNLMYLLRSELPSEGPAGSYIGMVESELERISGITKQTLRWNRETSDLAEAFQAGAMVNDVLRLFAGKIRNRQITVKLIGPRDLSLHGIVGQIRQVVANLVSNAIDASPLGGRVVVTIVESPTEAGFSLSDNGQGIPDSLKTHLFQPFISTKGDLGNGLGLYISKEIVERHGGRIDVDSSLERGTTMTVWLPRTNAA